MKLGASRSQLYDAQKVARAKWAAQEADWADAARKDFDEATWQPMDRAVSDLLRAVDQLGVLFNQIRQECEQPS
jgi:hypothetical protein